MRTLRRNKQLRVVCGFEPKTVRKKDGSIKTYVALLASSYSNFIKISWNVKMVYITKYFVKMET